MMAMGGVMIVAGARPNFPKLSPVLHELESRGHHPAFVHTGQHFDASMSEVFLRDLGIRDPDFHLGVGSGSHATQTARIMELFEPVVEQCRPDIVAVIGDVNSTVACALVAAKTGCRVAHIEAGLRSRDWSMPEEINRVVTDRLSDYLLAPSHDAVENLSLEGYRSDQIFLVGNVMIDALQACLPRAEQAFPDLARRLGIGTRPYLVVTLHRPSNVDDPRRISEIIDELDKITSDVDVVFPVHPRTRKMINAAGREGRTSVLLSDPLGYVDFLALESRAAVVLTDSGGVQEETTSLGVPCLTFRENTERPITVLEGTNKVIGSNPRDIRDHVGDALSNPQSPRCPALWDGRASERIVDILMADPNRKRRPTSL